MRGVECSLASTAEIDRGAPRPGTFERPLVGRMMVGATMRGTVKSSMAGTLRSSPGDFELHFGNAL